MKKFSLLILLTLVLVACGTDGHHFEVEGKLTNLNQGEFYVYSPDNVIEGTDTIKVQGGRFSYEIPCEKEGVLIVVFPNFSEQPIFAQPGKSVDIKGDASHLKELEITGTDANELMTKFRHQIANMTPPEIEKHVGLFISDHLESVVGPYLVDKFLLRKQQPDYKRAYRLLASMQKEQPRNGYLNRLLALCKPLADVSGDRLPAFKATDINGKSVSSASLSSAPVAVVYTWATWSYESTNLQQRLLDRTIGPKENSNCLASVSNRVLQPARRKSAVSISVGLLSAMKSCLRECWVASWDLLPFPTTFFCSVVAS